MNTLVGQQTAHEQQAESLIFGLTDCASTFQEWLWIDSAQHYPCMGRQVAGPDQGRSDVLTAANRMLETKFWGIPFAVELRKSSAAEWLLDPLRQLPLGWQAPVLAMKIRIVRPIG